jgi:hypothetical protein
VAKVEARNGPRNQTPGGGGILGTILGELQVGRRRPRGRVNALLHHRRASFGDGDVVLDRGGELHGLMDLESYERGPLLGQHQQLLVRDVATDEVTSVALEKRMGFLEVAALDLRLVQGCKSLEHLGLNVGVGWQKLAAEVPETKVDGHDHDTCSSYLELRLRGARRQVPDHFEPPARERILALPQVPKVDKEDDLTARRGCINDGVFSQNAVAGPVRPPVPEFASPGTNPTLESIDYVRSVFRSADGPLSRNEILRVLATWSRWMNRESLNAVIDYLAARGSITEGSRGLLWVRLASPKQGPSIREPRGLY